jgi:SAM-dependent methyltransferase
MMNGNINNSSMFFAKGDNIGFVTEENEYIVRSIYDEYEDYSLRIYKYYKKYALDDLGVVKTRIEENTHRLLHDKLRIIYPYEWPPALFKDAILFYLFLLLQLDKYGLTLKDALPENILFTGISPTFVDFFSILSVEDLTNEKWLKAINKKNIDFRLVVLQSMFVPYFLIPLMQYAEGDYNEGKRLLEECYCNNCNNILSDWNSHPIKLFRKKNNITNRKQLKDIKKLCLSDEYSWTERVRLLYKSIENLKITPEKSAYASYYSDKNEESGLSDIGSWNEKQRNISEFLVKYKPSTVLDIGSNTGWYSLLAARNGAKVISLDSDLSSVDELYKMAKYGIYKTITPVWMSFDDMNKEGFSLDACGKIQENPIHMSALKRLKCDMVFCLGLLHHLILGLGKSMESVIEQVILLTNKIAIFEFIDINDPLIKASPDFFPSLDKWNKNNYSIDYMKKSADSFGFQYSILPSSPSQSRSLVIFKRMK